jgi:ATP-binding cassette subfamily B multidrug efflux pump
MRGRTSFVIAQRLSTVRVANLILVLDRGHIAASGTHQQLLRTSGLYAEIYNRQFRPQMSGADDGRVAVLEEGGA